MVAAQGHTVQDKVAEPRFKSRWVGLRAHILSGTIRKVQRPLENSPTFQARLPPLELLICLGPSELCPPSPLPLSLLA